MTDRLEIPGAEFWCNRINGYADQAQVDGDLWPCGQARALRDYVNGLRERIAEWEEQYQEIIHEECRENDDRKHCTCVPDLRRRIAELERILDMEKLRTVKRAQRVGELEAERDRLRDELKGLRHTLDEERKVMAKMTAALEEERLRVKALQVEVADLEAEKEE